MFERFTEEARRVIVLAQEEARKLSHSYIGTEHLLLGVARTRQGAAAEILAHCGLSADAIRMRVLDIVGVGEDAPSGQIPFTPRAKHAFEFAAGISFERHQRVGPEHLLLGVLQRESVALRAIADAGAEPKLLAEIRAVLGRANVPYDAR